MTPGEKFVEALPRKTRFYDRHEQRSYELARATAACLIDDPALIRNGLAHAQRHLSGDASQSRYFVMWQEELRLDVTSVVRHLLEDSPRGALLRETQPVFCVLPDAVRRKIVAQARSGRLVSAA